jgi:hypothetical protein
MTGTGRTCDAAISYADLGWAILPVWWVQDGRCGCRKAKCDSPGKHPWGRFARHGLLAATKDDGKIRSWFANGHTPNLGIRTGAESGILVIDIDPRHGGDRGSLGQLPEAALVATGGGGEHLYFKMPAADIRSFKAEDTPKLGPGIDVRANGGYAIAPPSMHVSGNEYKWIRDPRGGLADLPQHILEKLIEKPATAKTAAPVTGIIRKGQRNNTFTSFAGAMRRRGMTEAAILAALREENRRCEEPLCDAELETIARSIGKKEPGDSTTARRDIDLRITSLDQVEEKEVEWLWEGWIPLSGLTIVGGNPGAGKTSLVLDIATRVSRGWGMPAGDKKGLHGTTLFVGDEDGAARIIRPRLRKMGADLARIKILEGLAVGGQEEPFSLDQGLEPLDLLIDREPQTKLLILDPITDYLGFAVNPDSNAKVRRVLRPLNPWADRHNVAVIGITHLNKRKDDDAAFRILGSMGFVAIARAVLGVSVHPEDSDKPAWEKRRIVTQIKESYAPEGDAVVFRIDQGTQTLLWDADSLPMGANEALSGGANGKISTTKAVAWLRAQLDNSQEPIEFAVLKERAEKEKVCSERTLYRAADEVGVSKATVGFGSERVVWWGKPGMDMTAWLNKGM